MYWAGDPNLYRNVSNRPTGLVDPLGTEEQEIAGTLRWTPVKMSNGQIVYMDAADYELTYDSGCKDGEAYFGDLTVAYYDFRYTPDTVALPLPGIKLRPRPGIFLRRRQWIGACRAHRDQPGAREKLR